MRYTFEESVELALRTWYPKDHPLHLEPHHPLGKLLGEWGELLDDYMKSLYKPGYEFSPLDELGDIWYYVRILCYQKNYKPNDSVGHTNVPTDRLIVLVMGELASIFINRDSYHPSLLDFPYSVLSEIAIRYNLTLDDLTRSNWEKLKPGSERGEQWAKARVETDYVNRGRIGLK